MYGSAVIDSFLWQSLLSTFHCATCERERAHFDQFGPTPNLVELLHRGL